MKVRWQKLSTIIFFWLFCEILLNLLGLDNLADYEEFLRKQKFSMEYREKTPA
ncbi:MAG: hypothetical protein AB4426_23560 [Xenococcaceae cyanobacterium]